METMLALLVLVLLAVPVLLVVALVWVVGLRRRVVELENAVADLDARAARAEESGWRQGRAEEPSPQPPAEPAVPEAVVPATRPLQATAVDTVDPTPPPASVVIPPPLPPRPPPVAAVAGPRIASRRRAAPAAPGAVEAMARTVKRWFTVGNVPVKVGMLVLLAGVAALLKYASDQGWLQLPIELRLAAVALAALAGLVFGWRQRRARPAFALALQGGTIGVLLLVVFAAFKLYGLIPAAAAFGLSVVLVAGLGVLAVLQDSRTLAVLGVLAGFLAPIWLSTGAGSHVALFSYYAVLNAAVFGIAWFKSWRVLNLLGFAFTWGIGTLWGVLLYSPDKLASTQPFLVLFFVFYLLIPVLFARRRPPGRRDLVDGCLLFGTPLVAFSLQAGLLAGARMPLAFCALAVAAVYALLAGVLRRREGYAILVQAYAVLAVGFATLAVPLALSANATASVFALEGAALAWLGLKQRRTLPQLAGAGLQLAAALAFSAGGGGRGVVLLAREGATAVANPAFMGALLIAVAGLAVAWCYHRARAWTIALPYYLWGVLWWSFTGLREIVEFAPRDLRADLVLVFLALSGWLAAEAHRLWPARALSATVLAALLLAIPAGLLQHVTHGHPFAGTGLPAWIAFAAFGVRALLCLRAAVGRIAGWAQFAWWLVWAWALTLFGAWLPERFDLGSGWLLAAIVLPWAGLALASVRGWRWLRRPLGEAFDGYRTAFQLTVFGLLGLWWWPTQLAAGGASPLPWVPLLNPLELLQAAVLLLAARWLWSVQAPAALAGSRTLPLWLAGFVMVTVVTLRAVHHWGGVAWGGALWDSSLAQTSLTVVWSLLGVVGWIVGSRRGHRGLWLAGAVLMAVVLAKLVFVDRQHLGNLLGIGSFLAYGLLCTVVGWFAPAPPKDEIDPAAEVDA